MKMERKNTLDTLAKNSSEMWQSNWEYTSRKTFENNFIELSEKHPGEYAAIDGTNLLGVNNLDYIESEYLQQGKTHIKIFYIPKKNEDEISFDLLLLSPPVFE